MKKMQSINGIFSLAIILFFWIPITRIFLIGNNVGDYLVFGLSILLIASSLICYRKYRSRFDIFTLFIGLSPYLFFLISIILIWFGVMPFAS